MRNDTLETKILGLVRQSCGYNTYDGHDTSMYQANIINLLQRFQNDRVYVVPMPVFRLQHPDLGGYFRGEYDETIPLNKTLNVNTQQFRDFSHIEEVIQNKLDLGQEIFIYMIIPSPRIAELEYEYGVDRRPIMRWVNTSLDCWYNIPIPFRDNEIHIRKQIKHFKFQ